MDYVDSKQSSKASAKAKIERDAPFVDQKDMAADSPTVADTTDQPKSTSKGSPFQAYFRLWSYASPLDVILRTIAAATALGSGTAEPLMAIIFGNLVNDFNTHEAGGVTPAEFRAAINRNALYFVYLFIGKFVCVYCAATLFSVTASRMTRNIRLQYLRTVLHQPVSYFDRNTPGSIAMSLSTDTNAIEVGLGEKVGTVFQAISMIITAFAIAFSRSWKLTLVVATIVPYMIFTTGFLGWLNTRIETKIKEILSKSSGIAEEALSSIINVTALGAQDKIVQKFRHNLDMAKPYASKIGPIQATIYGNMFFVMHSAYALSLFYGVKLISQGGIKNGGTVITVMFCMVIGSSSMGFIAPEIPDFVKAFASAQIVLKVIEQSASSNMTNDHNRKLEQENLTGAMELKNITFKYPERPTITVLDALSLKIPANQVTAVVGHSGSGKSTIVGLLERWYDLSHGSIDVDGMDINQLDLKWWRSQIGLVQQEPMLFNDTIYQNVLNGLRGSGVDLLSEQEKRILVINACTQANAHEFIESLPNQYETLVGERADLLSGGQKQRIAIARSIISNPKILLLDEATSSLDSESERTVQNALDKASSGRTTVMIAHKLSTVEHANNIVVLSKGRIVEQGTHAALLALGGHYCRLLQAQGSSPEGSRQNAISDGQGLQQVASHKDSITRNALADERVSQAPPSLESEWISRRYGFFRCFLILLSQQRAIIPFVILGLLCALVGGASFPVQAFLFSKLVTVFELSGQHLVNRGNFWALMFFVSALANLVSYFVTYYFLGIACAAAGRFYREKYLKAMLSQDIGFFQAGGNSSGSLTALLFSDSESLELLIGMSIGLIVVFVSDLIFCCILAIAIYWKMALVAIFGCLPALLLAGFLRMRMELQAQERCSKFFLESARFSAEAVGAIRTVCSLTIESKVEDRYNSKLHEALVASRRRTVASMILYALSDTLDLLASGLAFWYGGHLVSYGEMSVTQYFIIFTAIIFGGQAAGFMFGYTSSINRAHTAMNRILYIMNFQAPINSSTGLDPKSTPPPPPSAPAIEFRNVHFRYPSRTNVPVLRGLSLSVPRGAHVCIVGPSGSGKSTIVLLLERFYDVSLSETAEKEQKGSHAGEIYVYGRPITGWDVTSLRKVMGLVAQDTTLYQGTIRENILLGIDEDGRDDDFDARVTSACREANIDEFITSLPEDYNTDIGSRGVALSGGQRQRIALARCLIRNPDILLLDEATSALDPESERAVREAIRRAQEDRHDLTVISVTHQVESMRDADCILVVDKGVVAEEGRWDDLMARKGRLWGMVLQGEVQGI
ncbi:ABC transporter [Lepidopterella palustris CBS 459.81]|uniref:ABC transporter n=1 Tax=Lepidopterella palustris CBS 459.81 TaxID=1314670 RepID=A0A8E2EJT6_9PEZI|nr:ABC transporter [Lepidopterella palustris CBS 459.81]